MKLIKPAAAPLLIQLISWIVALTVGGAIAYLVFNFGYYASGLAAYNEDVRRRQETPIPLSFGDPNTAPPAPAPADPNAAVRDPNSP
ncbi:MAG TPA: hypothetical protein VFE84_10785, partial [Patescibacteria group bacterium]|nr:hypothetical protein [Patescibacteria group bacterium]